MVGSEFFARTVCTHVSSRSVFMHILQLENLFLTLLAHCLDATCVHLWPVQHVHVIGLPTWAYWLRLGYSRIYIINDGICIACIDFVAMQP